MKSSSYWRGSAVRSDKHHEKNLYFEVVQPEIILNTELFTSFCSGSLHFRLYS